MGNGVRRGIAAASVAVALFATIASGDDKTATKVETSSSATASGAVAAAAADSAKADSGDKAKAFAIGDTVELGDWQIVANKLIDPVTPTNDFMTPDAGNRWVAVDATVSNKSSKAKTLSSILCFDLRDSEDRKYDATITGGEGAQLDGEIPAGDRLRGQVTFEVPKTAKGFWLSFHCDVLSSSSAVINLS